LDILRAEKLVIRSQGRGTLVAGAGSSDLRCKFDGVRDADGAPVAWRFELQERNVRCAGPAERDKLNLVEGEQLVDLIRLRRAGDRLVQREHLCVPLAAFGDLSDLAAADTTIESLAYRNGVMISRLDERLSIERADSEAARQFKVAEGASLLRLERLVVDGAERPLEWRITQCHLDGYRYHAAASVDSRHPAPRPRAPLAEPRPHPRSWRR
jgi:GntR family transcriptional regulator